MISARCLLAAGLIVATTQVQAADWVGDDINDILAKVRSIFTTVTGNIKDAADDLIDQKGKRTQAIKDNVDDLLTFFENRKTPLQDFVNGGAGRCGAGSPCAQFRTDLRTFALQMAELKDRFPALEQHGLADTSFFAELVKIMPPVALFGLHEMMKRIPNWQDLPVDLADIFDEIGDSEAFSTTNETSAQVAAAAIGDMKTASAVSRAATGLNTASGPLEKFCNQGKEAGTDDVRHARLKSLMTGFKNSFDSISEYPPDTANISLAGFGFGNVKLPTKAFIKTIANVLDSVRDLMEAHRESLAVCARVEADLAACTPLAEYRTKAGSKKAYQVFAGIMTRSSLAELSKTNANIWFVKARTAYNAGKYKETYANLCTAYAAL